MAKQRLTRLFVPGVLLMTLNLSVQPQTAAAQAALAAPLIPDQPSTLLPPGTTALPLGITTAAPTDCRYSLNQQISYGQMTPFESGDDTIYHQTLLTRLNPDPSNVNNVYVWCDGYPDHVLHLKYRSLPKVNPSYPRTGDLWGWQEYAERPIEDAARIDLWLGAEFEPERMRQMRILNPEMLILTSMNAVEPSIDVPEEYYLHDIHGNRVEVWPGEYRLNITKPEVAEFQAIYAYQLILQSNLMFDGVFFDNVMLTQSWQDTDIYGTPFLYDYNEDGIHDNAAEFDAAWRAGVLHELRTFRQLMPYAILSGHAMDIDDPDIAPMFNATSIGFDAPDAIEGEIPFAQLWQRYSDWQGQARQPQVTMIESAIPNQIAYGYGYHPTQDAPPATLDFGRDYYPYMRFGLATTLMQDGYFTHEIGDTDHGNGWWYDELDFDLGYPLGPAQFTGSAEIDTMNRVANADFEDADIAPWTLSVDSESGNSAQLKLQQGDAGSGSRSARVDIAATVGDRWRITLQQANVSLVQGTTYSLTLLARSDRARTLALSSQKSSPDWRNYGLYESLWISDQWEEYTVYFTANETVNDARIQILLAGDEGSVWIDHVRLTERPPELLHREFENGLVLLNGTQQTQTITVGNGFRRLTSDQAPRYQYIVDDAEVNFSTDADWERVEITTGEWKARPPYYHAWDGAAHLGSTGKARWDLAIPEADVYAISAWWPAAPDSAGWNGAVTYEVISDGQVVASRTVDQRTSGDQWNWIGDGTLTPGAYVQMTCTGGAPCVADALYVSSAARYNDGSNALVVTLQPMDGIVLERIR